MLFFTTKQSNPNLSPDIHNYLNIINFVIENKGLEDQLLSIIVTIIDKRLEDQRIECTKIRSNSEMTLKKLEEKILKMLQES